MQADNQQKKSDDNKERAPQVLNIADIGDEAVGGKATGLAKLHALGLSVPSAFVIVNAEIDCFPPSLEQHYQQIGCAKVAVRSSAIGEDSAEASFAGQYETILNVEGMADLRNAINQCVASLESNRAQAYQHDQSDLGHFSTDQTGSGEIAMCVVVQQMVDARSAGVLFTADPVSGRHDRLIIDAISGLGESLVSGESTPDHYELDQNNNLISQDLIEQKALLKETELHALTSAARTAEKHIGEPLDMEWAIDQSGELFWLQARPITTLGSDLNELDTLIPADQVITRCNVGEMMPGAVPPLTFTVQGRAIENGMQHMMVSYGGRPAINEEWSQINLFFGHMFINISGGLESARYVSINTAETIAQSLCGRPVPELQEPPNKAPLWRRWWGSFEFFRYTMRAPRIIRDFERRLKHFHMKYYDNSSEMIAELEEKFDWLCEACFVHLQSSAGAGVMEGIVQAIVSKGKHPASTEEQAEAARLLAGAEEVESAVLVDHLDEVVDLIARHPEAKTAFQEASSTEALAWLRSKKSGAARLRFADFLQHHGHRSYRELCLREKAWIDEPEKLIITMQASVAARFQSAYQAKKAASVNLQQLPWLMRLVLPKAHYSVRQREHTKSLMVETTHRIKRAYYHLGYLLKEEGVLKDEDLVFFLTKDELPILATQTNTDWNTKAELRRQALSFHENMEFDDVYVGNPEPIQWHLLDTHNERELAGRPVSRGVVEGKARVAITVQEAASLQPGEILVAPITDVGWTPYFSLIAGLATDVGSAVSHGAVIAREYGLPCIVNLRTATKAIKTGDLIRLDADKGLLTLLESQA